MFKKINTFIQSLLLVLKKNFILVILLVILAIILAFSYKKFDVPNIFNSIIIVISTILIFIFSMNLIEKIITHLEKDQISRMTLAILSASITTLLVSPFFIYLIILYFKINRYILIKIGDIGNWIEFAGSIIGGGLTLIGVVFAFILDKKNRELELDKTQIPKLHIESSISANPNTGEQLNTYYYSGIEEYLTLNLDLSLKNVSKYTAEDFEIFECSLTVFNEHDLIIDEYPDPIISIDLKSCLIETLKDIELLFGEYSSEITIPVKIKSDYIKKECDINIYTLKTILHYKSQFKQLTYELNSNIEFKIKNLDQDENLKDKKLHYFRSKIFQLLIIKTSNNLKKKIL